MRWLLVGLVVVASCTSDRQPKSEQERACLLPPSEFASYVASGVALGSDPKAFLDGLRAVCPKKVDVALAP